MTYNIKKLNKPFGLAEKNEYNLGKKGFCPIQYIYIYYIIGKWQYCVYNLVIYIKMFRYFITILKLPGEILYT